MVSASSIGKTALGYNGIGQRTKYLSWSNKLFQCIHIYLINMLIVQPITSIYQTPEIWIYLKLALFKVQISNGLVFNWSAIQKVRVLNDNS